MFQNLIVVFPIHFSYWNYKFALDNIALFYKKLDMIFKKDKNTIKYHALWKYLLKCNELPKYVKEKKKIKPYSKCLWIKIQHINENMCVMDNLMREN